MRFLLPLELKKLVRLPNQNIMLLIQKSVLLKKLLLLPKVKLLMISRYALILGVYYKWPKFKYQLLSGTGWFSYKIWTKNSKTPMVNLLKNLRPFRNYNFKIQWEIHFRFFWILAETLQKKILNRNMDILISNLLSESNLDFGKWSNGKYANTRICVFSVWPLPEVDIWILVHYSTPLPWGLCQNGAPMISS